MAGAEPTAGQGVFDMHSEKHRAPDVEVTLSDGSQRHLRDFWKSQPLVLVFLRHLG